MNFVEFMRGVGNVLLVMAIAGGVAYVGDRVGHQVGRKRLTLFNIRPRYTSTIIAIGTGMTIALVVTLVAIFASQEVKTAFFKLSSLNAQIADLQTRQSELITKVQNGHLVVANETLMVPYAKIIKKNMSGAERLATIQDYYSSAVRYVNNTYPALGLKAYTNPPDIDKQLNHLANDVDIVQRTYPGDVMLSVTSGQNLFEGDQIHFEISGTPDQKLSRRPSRSSPCGISPAEVERARESRSANCSAAFPRSLCSDTYLRFSRTAYKRLSRCRRRPRCSRCWANRDRLF